MDPGRLLLSAEQAVKAVCLDFRGYGPQPMLFCEVLRTIHGEEAIFQREPGKNGLWVATGSRQRMTWLEGSDLVAYMCAAVARADLDPRRLAAVCRLVFQTACHVVCDMASSRPAIAIDTGMDAFACRQCGRCCRVLDYSDGLTGEDVARLREMGRQDILKWVGVARDGHGRETYRIWMVPGTNRFAAPCPFLKRGPSENIWQCRIHDVKPHICRHYPVSRKHARMTGCPGFDKDRARR